LSWHQAVLQKKLTLAELVPTGVSFRKGGVTEWASYGQIGFWRKMLLKSNKLDLSHGLADPTGRIVRCCWAAVGPRQLRQPQI